MHNFNYEVYREEYYHLESLSFFFLLFFDGDFELLPSLDDSFVLSLASFASAGDEGAGVALGCSSGLGSTSSSLDDQLSYSCCRSSNRNSSSSTFCCAELDRVIEWRVPSTAGLQILPAAFSLSHALSGLSSFA